MDYIGEHLLPGYLGHFFIILFLVSSILASFCYFRSVQLANRNRETISLEYLSWKRMARIFFYAEVVSILAIFGILFYIISNHLFEYHYAWKHSSRSLEFKYLLSCFWEGQEGSFMLWAFWHAVLGIFVIRKEREWEGPVMTVVNIVQFCLATMVVGFVVGDVKIGSNPFVLLRNAMDAPIFARPDYLTLVQDGNDLNPLLQNYWMQIHPPVLFLGFASTLIPFAFAIGGLWTKKYTEWTKRALPWALFSAGVFGLGIMMGAAWAYESLNFGGYWAWDPVENASLVPWMVLVAGIHTLLVYRHTGNALRSTYLFLILSFSLVLYSTYLTRSGDLQETSVHAFTGDDKDIVNHLRIFLAALILPSFGFLIARYKHIPFIRKEEETSSREFWMFVGSLVLFLSALLIIVMTSIPVINKIIATFGGSEGTFKPFALGEDTAHSYNRIQVFVAIVIGLLTGFGMYLRYKTTGKPYLKKLLWPSVAGLVLGGLLVVFGDVQYREHGIGYLAAIWLAIAAAVYAIIANSAYIFTGYKGSLKRAGGSLAHVGFGLMLLGILLSSSKKEVISHNTSGIFIPLGEGSKEKPGENLTLVKGLRTTMGNYWVTYERDSAHPTKPLWYYHIKFERKDGKENFTLTPNAFVNYKGNEGLMANPDARHYLGHDIFTYITSLPNPDKTKDTTTFKPQNLNIGDTVFYSNGFMVLQDLTTRDNLPFAGFAPDDSASVATVKITSKTGSLYTVEAKLIEKGGVAAPIADTVMAENLVLQLQKVGAGSAELGIKESNAIMQYVTLKAYKFPYINVLWFGTILMVIGFLVSMYWRIKTNRSLKAVKRAEPMEV